MSTLDAAAEISSPAAIIALPEELEKHIASIMTHRSVHGVMLLKRAEPVARKSEIDASETKILPPPSIIRMVGSILAGPTGLQYAKSIGTMVAATEQCINEMEANDGLKLLRVRTHRHEIIITADPIYLLIAIQDPTAGS